jgi:hypothetical protein
MRPKADLKWKTCVAYIAQIILGGNVAVHLLILRAGTSETFREVEPPCEPSACAKQSRSADWRLGRSLALPMSTAQFTGPWHSWLDNLLWLSTKPKGQNLRHLAAGDLQLEIREFSHALDWPASAGIATAGRPGVTRRSR